MKKYLFFLSFLFAVCTLSAQVTWTTDPSPVVQQSGASVTITFDVSAMPSLAGNAGPLYVHTGVSIGTNNWDSVHTVWPSGGTSTTNIPKYQLTPAGANKWTLNISPDINTYYGLANGDVVTALNFVIRTADGSKQSTPDIFVYPVYQPGLNFAFTNPSTSFQVVNTGATVTYSASSSQSAALSLYIDDNQIATTTGTSISQTYTFNTAGSYWAIAEAGTAPNTVRDSVRVLVETAAARPALPDGINIVDNNTVTFILYAPYKNNVYVVGDFNNWQPSDDYLMKKDGDYWWLTVSNLQPDVEYAFQYLVDGNLYVGDAYAQKVLDPWNDKNISSTTYPNLKPYPVGKNADDGMVSVFQTNETPYNWEVTNFQPPRQDKLVIYELLIRDFTSTGAASKSDSSIGNLNGVMSQLDYLQGLGINAIELMPSQEFDGNDSWGYNPCYYFAMDKVYGTKEMYKQFIDECHRRGIAVILDIVYNQATGQHPFAKLYWNAVTGKPADNNPWFNVDAPHPYSVFCDFNHESPLTRAFFKRNLTFLLEEYKFDGFRFDLTKGFTQTPSTTDAQASMYDSSRVAILKDYYSQVKATNPNAYMIIEHFVSSEEPELAEAGMMPWSNMNNAYCQTIMGFQTSSDFNGVNGWTRSWTNNNLVGYMESHDEERMMYKAKTWGATTDIQNNLATQLNRAALNAAFFLPIPGAKMIWQFGEVGYGFSINSAVGTTVISDSNRTARKDIRWDYVQVPARMALYDTYYKLNKLREQYADAFDNQSYWDMQIGANNWGGRRICLNSPDLKMVIVGNFSPSGSLVTYPNFPTAGTWYDLMTGEPMDVTNTNMTITLDAGKFKVLTNKEIDLSAGISVIRKGKLSLQQTPDYLTIVTTEPVVSAKIYTINGILLKQVQGKNTISIVGLPKGCYILNVQLSGQNTSFKFIN